MIFILVLRYRLASSSRGLLRLEFASQLGYVVYLAGHKSGEIELSTSLGLGEVLAHPVEDRIRDVVRARLSKALKRTCLLSLGIYEAL